MRQLCDGSGGAREHRDEPGARGDERGRESTRSVQPTAIELCRAGACVASGSGGHSNFAAASYENMPKGAARKIKG